jgi:hypothetical protein
MAHAAFPGSIITPHAQRWADQSVDPPDDGAQNEHVGRIAGRGVTWASS